MALRGAKLHDACTNIGPGIVVDHKARTRIWKISGALADPNRTDNQYSCSCSMRRPLQRKRPPWLRTRFRSTSTTIIFRLRPAIAAWREDWGTRNRARRSC